MASELITDSLFFCSSRMLKILDVVATGTPYPVTISGNSAEFSAIVCKITVKIMLPKVALLGRVI